MGLRKQQKICRCVLPLTIATTRTEIPSAEITVRKLVALMEEQSSSKFYDRQVLILQEFLTACPYAYWMQDLAYVIKLIDLSIDRSQVTCLFGTPVSRLLSLCYHPPMLMKSSDILTYCKDLEEYFSFLGYLLVRFSKNDYQKWVLECIYNLLTVKSTIPCSCKLKYRKEAIVKSQIPNTISELIELGTQNNYKEILEIATILTDLIPCCKINKYGLLQNVMVQLDETWYKRRDEPPKNTFSLNLHVEYLCKILWNVLGKFKLPLSEQITPPDLFALWSLRLVFQYSVQHNMISLRSNILGIILMCARLFPDLPYLECGLVDDISILSIASEIGVDKTWAVNVKFTRTESDYEIKKLCLILVCLFADNERNIITMKRRQLIPGLLMLIIPKLEHNWHPALCTNLTIIALRALETLAPVLPFDFIQNNGPLRLIVLVEYYLIEPYNEMILQATLKTLAAIAKSDDDTLLVLKSNSANYILISHDLFSQTRLTIILQKCLSYTFDILEVMYEKYPIEEEDMNEFFSKIIFRLTYPTNLDSNFSHPFIISAIDFIWQVLIHNKHVLSAFVESGGVFKLLDLIKSLSFPCNIPPLGILVDLCEEGNCIPQVITWRKDGMAIQEFLLHLFRKENSLIGVQINSYGIIEDPDRPLMCPAQECEITCGFNKTNELSANINNIFASSRPKIYAIFQLLNSYYKDKVEILNNRYFLYTENLKVIDQITMLLVHNFLRLKYGEAWEELLLEIKNTRIEPLEVDATIMQDYVKGFRQWSRFIKYSQEQLLNEDKKRILKEEKELYRTLKDAKLAPTLDAFHLAYYITRTTEALFRITSKMKYNCLRSKKLELFEIDQCTHLTFFDNITVTPVFNQLISVRCDVMEPPTFEELLEMMANPIEELTEETDI